MNVSLVLQKMNSQIDRDYYNEDLLQYAIDINWLINRLSKIRRHEAIAYELTKSSIDIYLYRSENKNLSSEERYPIIEKIKNINSYLLILQKKNYFEFKVEIDRLITKTNSILEKI